MVENLYMMWKSFKYSLSFLWRGAAKLTLVRLSLLVFGAILAFVTVQIMGKWFTAFQVQASSKGEMTIKSFLFSPLGLWMYAFFGVVILNVVFSRIDQFIREVWSEKLQVTQEMSELEQISTLDIALFRSKKLDDLDKQIQNLPSGWNVRMTYANQMLEIFRFFSKLISYSLAVFIINPLYALVMVIFAIPLLMIRIRSVSLRWDLNEELIDTHKKKGVDIKHFRNMNLFNMSKQWLILPELLNNINNKLGEIKSKNIALAKKLIFMSYGGHFLMFISFVFILSHATWVVLLTSGAIGTLTVLVTSFQSFMGNLEMLAYKIADQWFSARAVVLMEETFFTLKPKVKNADNPKELREDFQSLEFKDLYFTYPNDVDQIRVLKGIDTCIKAGERIAIIGANGCGKSSFLSLFLREYDPIQGQVLVNGVDLRDLNLNDWLKKIVKFSQYDGRMINHRSLIEEVTSSVLDQPIDEEIVWQALELSCMADLVHSLSDGLQTQVGEDFGGRDFSGGQKQRIALARALYRLLKIKASVFVFDELDTGMDVEAAQKIMDKIFELDNITLIMVTHHIGYVRRCDRVWLMEDGLLIDDNKPEVMVENNQLYQRLASKDKLRQQLKAVETT